MSQWIAYKTIVRRELMRIFRIWTQTLLPSVITISLYFIIFGNLIGSRIQNLQGMSYIDYITPGLIMLAVITNAYSNVAGSFYSLRFQKCIEELLIAPVTNSVIVFGFITGGVLRGLMVGILVTCVASFYTSIHIESYILFFSVLCLTAMTFSLAGFLNAVLAKRFDDVAFIPTFVLTPLIYLGGVFYSLDLLPPFWQTLSLANPILYLVNAFRFSMLRITDVPIQVAFVIIISASMILWWANLYLLSHSKQIRS